jgi:hypothetical protein
MLKRLVLLISIVALVGACGGGDKPAPAKPVPEPIAKEPEPEPPKEPEPPPFELALGDATAWDGKKEVFRMKADGSTEMASTVTKKKKTTTEWKPGPMIKADGTVELDGKAVAQITADGAKNLETGEPFPIKIAGDEISATGEGDVEVKFVLDAEGNAKVVGGPMDGRTYVIKSEDANVRRTVFLVMGTMQMSVRKVDPPPAKKGK